MSDPRTTRPEPGQAPSTSFDRELRSWASRPASTSPREATERLARRLEEEASPEPRRYPFRLATAAALALALIGGWWALDGRRAEVRQELREELRIPTLDENVALIWLNAETPLYLTLTPPPAAKEPS
jgi:hypothetical protein